MSLGPRVRGRRGAWWSRGRITGVLSVMLAICVGGAVETTRAQTPERRPEQRRLPEATLERPQQGQPGAGMHQVRWEGSRDDGQPVASGGYVCRLRAGGEVVSHRMTLLK